MLWIDKYQPKLLDELNCHSDVTELLKKVSEKGDCPHLLFYGPSGAGKKTRIMALLRALYGDGIDKVKAETISPEGTTAEFVCCSSAYHNQISAPELGTKDRVCVQYMIKQLASQIGATAFAARKANIPKYRVFVIQEAEVLTTEAQAGLRRTLERYVRTARLFMHCQQLSAIMPPLRSRCLCIRVPLPTIEEVEVVLANISASEKLNTSREYLTRVAESSGRDIRKAILMLENAAVLGFPAAETLAVVSWQRVCADMVAKLRQTQTPKCLLELRELTYDVLTACIPGDVVLKTVAEMLLTSTPPPSDEMRLNITRAAAHYSHSLALGSKAAWHIEAFLAQCMNFFSQAP